MTTRTPDKSVSCDGKVPFDTFTQANQVCKRKSKGKRDLCRMPYRCAHCHQWHVGTRSRKMTQADLLPVDAKQRAASVHSPETRAHRVSLYRKTGGGQ